MSDSPFAAHLEALKTAPTQPGELAAFIARCSRLNYASDAKAASDKLAKEVQTHGIESLECVSQSLFLGVN